MVPLLAPLVAMLSRPAVERRRPSPWAILGWALAILVGLGARFAVLGRPDATSRVQHLIANLPALPAALAKVLLPIDLSVIATRAQALEPAHLALEVVVLIALVIAWQLSDAGRRRRLLIGLAAFVVVLAPGLLVGNDLALENRLYMPAALLMATLASLAPETVHLRRLVPVVGLLLLLSTFRYLGPFASADAFTAAAVASAPQAPLAHLNRGRAVHEAGREVEAAEHYRRAMTLDPNYPVVRNNLAVFHLRRGELPDAERLLRDELKINPNYVPAWMNLATVQRDQGRMDEAVQSWAHATALAPDNIDALGEQYVYWMNSDPARAESFRARLEAAGARFVDPSQLSPGRP